jgi:hypothetical protein
MSEHHHDLVVRFYPRKGAWMCVVQRVDADGMPIGGDLVSATGATKDEARGRAAAMADDPEIRDALQVPPGT